MTTRADIRSEVQRRLGDALGSIWPDTELNGFIDYAIEGLYPTFYQRQVAETTASAGPVQTLPVGARNLYRVSHKKADRNRVRSLFGWEEGNGDAYVPRTGITNDTLVWAWTEGWTAPATDVEALSFPAEAGEVVVLRSMVAALEKLLTDRVSQEKYHAVFVREGVSEDDVDLIISNLRDSIRERVERTLPLPEVRK